MKKLIKILIPLVLGGVFIWVIWGLWIDISYSSRLPKAPDEASDRIHQVIVNHSARYASEHEAHILAIHDDFAPVVMIPAVLVGLFAFIWNIIPLRDGRSE